MSRVAVLLTAKTAAERLTVSMRTLRAYIASGALPVVRLSARSVRIHPDDLDEFIEKRRTR